MVLADGQKFTEARHLRTSLWKMSEQSADDLRHWEEVVESRGVWLDCRDKKAAAASSLRDLEALSEDVLHSTRCSLL